jgi:hypothetical protein
MHRYNNQDHSMLTAMLAVQNILGAQHDLFGINTEREYHEQVKRSPGQDASDLGLLASTQPRIPERICDF